MSNKQEMHQRQHTDKSYLFRRCVTLCTRADLSANLPICAAVLHALGIKSIDPITSQPISPNEIRAQLAIAMANMLLDTNSGVTPGELAQRSPLRPVTAYCEIDSDDARNSHEKVGDSLASQPEKAKGIKQVGSNTLLEDTIAILVEHHLLTPAMLSKLTKDAKQANKADNTWPTQLAEALHRQSLGANQIQAKEIGGQPSALHPLVDHLYQNRLIGPCSGPLRQAITHTHKQRTTLMQTIINAVLACFGLEPTPPKVPPLSNDWNQKNQQIADALAHRQESYNQHKTYILKIVEKWKQAVERKKLARNTLLLKIVNRWERIVRIKISSSMLIKTGTMNWLTTTRENRRRNDSAIVIQRWFKSARLLNIIKQRVAEKKRQALLLLRSQKLAELKALDQSVADLDPRPRSRSPKAPTASSPVADTSPRVRTPIHQKDLLSTSFATTPGNEYPFKHNPNSVIRTGIFPSVNGMVLSPIAISTPQEGRRTNHLGQVPTPYPSDPTTSGAWQSPKASFIEGIPGGEKSLFGEASFADEDGAGSAHGTPAHPSNPATSGAWKSPQASMMSDGPSTHNTPGQPPALATSGAWKSPQASMMSGGPSTHGTPGQPPALAASGAWKSPQASMMSDGPSTHNTPGQPPALATSGAWKSPQASMMSGGSSAHGTPAHQSPLAASGKWRRQMPATALTAPSAHNPNEEQASQPEFDGSFGTASFASNEPLATPP